MKQVLIDSNPSGRFTMPTKCPGCGGPLEKNPLTQSEIKIEKASSVVSDLKSLSIGLCDGCGKKLSSIKMMTNIALALIGFGLLGPVFFGMSTPPQMAQAGVSVCMGLVLLWVADRNKKKRVGIRCKRLSKREWEFRFENDAVADEFQKANSPEAVR